MLWSCPSGSSPLSEMPAIAVHMWNAGQLDTNVAHEHLVFDCIERLCSRNAPYVLSLPSKIVTFANESVLDVSAQVQHQFVLGAPVPWQQPRVLSRFMYYVWQSRARHYDINTVEGFAGFISFFAFHYMKVANLPSSLLPNPIVALLNQPIKDPDSPVTVGMYLQSTQSAVNRFAGLAPDDSEALLEVSFEALLDLLRFEDPRLIPAFVSRFWWGSTWKTEPPLSNFEFVAWRSFGPEGDQPATLDETISRKAKSWLVRNLLPDMPELDICCGSVGLEGGGETWMDVQGPPSSVLAVYSDARAKARVGCADRAGFLALRELGLTVQEITFSGNRGCADEEYQANEALVRAEHRGLHVLAVPPATAPELLAIHSHRFGLSDHIVGQYRCEFSAPGTIDELGLTIADEIWVPSEYVRQALSPHTDAPVITMGLPVLPARRKHDRSYFDLPETSYVFLLSLDATGDVERKNPLAAIRAFRLAFGRSRANAMLVICDCVPDRNFTTSDNAHWTMVLESAAADARIRVISKELSNDEFDSLLNLCDCHVSLHRSDSFGYSTAAAMRIGKPVIVTNWSGTKDYCDELNSFPVGYVLSPVPMDVYGFQAPGRLYQWAEADYFIAATHMRNLVADPRIGIEKGAQALDTMRVRYSFGVVRRRCQERLMSLGWTGHESLQSIANSGHGHAQ